MAGWGFGQWGFAPWGGGAPVSFECTPAGPQLQIVVRSPGPGEQNVAADRILKVAFYDSTLSIDPSTLYVTINGQAAVSGALFLNGFNGSIAFVNNVFTVQIFNPLGWEYDDSFETFVHLKNLAGECLEDTWTWFTATDPVCYTGITPLDIEVALQQPLLHLLEAESLRNLLLQIVLRTRNKSVRNYSQKAARAIYQTAFSTELSTVQNLYVPRDEKALAVTVCERERLILVDTQLLRYEDITKRMIESFNNKGFITKEYINTFHDYLNSTNYNFRVSLICNLVILAKALELRGLA